MVNRTTSIFLGTALAIGVGLSTVGRADDREKNAVQNATVQFGQPQPQTPEPAPPVGANGAQVTHFLLPDDVTIHKGGTVTFVVNGGGHGIAIHEVSKNTTRDDIAEDLCDGTTHETANATDAEAIADRKARSAVCNGTLATQNLNYDIRDGKGNLIIHTGTNSPANENNRVDDPENGHRLLATSGASPGDTANPPAITNNHNGAFLVGSAAPSTPGNRIQVQFLKTGRYLVICMNRGHSLNDHMFGFVNVVDDGVDK